MRRVVASSLALGVFVLLACSSDYGSDDPANPGGEGGASSSGDGGSSGTAEGGGNKEGGFEPGKPITVTGKIVSYGVPLPNLPVVVGGKTAVNTSALGTFTVADVIPPYNVSFAIKTNDSTPRITVYQGLTRSDPTLVALGTNGELRPNVTTATSLGGKVDGAGGPPFTKAPVIGLGGPNRAYGFTTVDAANGTWSMTGTAAPVWYGAPSIAGTLYAALVIDTTTPATAFFGKLENVTLTGATSITDKNVTLQSLPVGELEAVVTAPAVYNDTSKPFVNMGIRYKDAAGYFIRLGAPLTYPLDVKRVVPLVPDGDYQLSVGYTVGGDGELSFAKKTTPGAATAKISINLPTPPLPDSPADNATVGLGETFKFGAFDGGVHRFTLVAANQPTITIVSADNFITLPDLAPFAVSIPTGVEYTWRGAGYRPIDSVDSDDLPRMLAVIDGNLPDIDECEIGIGVARRVTFK